MKYLDTNLDTYFLIMNNLIAEIQHLFDNLIKNKISKVRHIDLDTTAKSDIKH